MSWWIILLLIAGGYLAIGIVFAVLLLQTPYGDNPLWVMIVFWPLFLWEIIFG